ncbi:MAG TPA: hypothetical protein IGS52_23780 [Oscillatoriaceae cyanobacterium M33_DOE_052]|uniref:Addiction module component n=1 Tax=Planktothricoides sp. SpSt-374 TaxID=2282167 RepID=A0A7C3ZZ71_9CYAN|nr:hypothetical protein [Oscillatoriaceae cyanobacterium M33_DOE_052]
MLLPELKAEIMKLPPGDRLALVAAIVESLQDSLTSIPERSNAIHRMRGLLKTDQPTPTDQDVAAILETRRLEKYLP